MRPAEPGAPAPPLTSAGAIWSLSGILLLATLTLTWGFNWPMMKLALQEVPPWTFRTLCVMVGGAALLALTGIERRTGVNASPFEQVGEGGNPCHFLLHPLHQADGNTELVAYHGVGPGDRSHSLHAADGASRQGDCASACQLLHQHAPALTGIVRSADDLFR